MMLSGSSVRLIARMTLERFTMLPLEKLHLSEPDAVLAGARPAHRDRALGQSRR